MHQQCAGSLRAQVSTAGIKREGAKLIRPIAGGLARELIDTPSRVMSSNAARCLCV